MSKIKTILQCFVDLNLELDENSSFFIGLPNISFDKSEYYVMHGQYVDVKLVLSEPSKNGLEEFDIAYYIKNIQDDTIHLKTDRITFDIGEQERVISIPTSLNSSYDNIASINLSIDFAINAYIGRNCKSEINIISESSTRLLSINQQGGSVVPGVFESSNPPVLNFSAFEGSSKDIIFSLNAPSKFGTEKAEVQFNNITVSDDDYSIMGSLNLEWAVGEKDKLITVKAKLDNELEDSETLSIKLISPQNCIIDGFYSAEFTILDQSPRTRYATANLQGLYIQKGGSLSNVELRYIKRSTTADIEDSTWRMFIKFGDYIEQHWNTFSPLNTAQEAPKCLNGCISRYDPLESEQFQLNNNLFFGKNPSTNKYGDLRLRIKNMGSHSCKINNESISVGQSILMTVDSFDYKIKLPANDVLIGAGTLYDGATLTEDTLTECLYEFTFEVDYDGLNFKLRDSDNSVSNNREFKLGVHRFSRTYDDVTASIPGSFYNLTTKLDNVWPFWRGDFTYPHTEPYCILPGDMSTPDPEYPTENSNLESVIIDGLVFLHQTTTNFNENNTTKTSYDRFEFMPNGGTVGSSGCTSVNVQETHGSFAPQLQTSTIPFLVV